MLDKQEHLAQLVHLVNLKFLEPLAQLAHLLHLEFLEHLAHLVPLEHLERPLEPPEYLAPLEEQGRRE